MDEISGGEVDKKRFTRLQNTLQTERKKERKKDRNNNNQQKSRKSKKLSQV